MTETGIETLSTSRLQPSSPGYFSVVEMTETGIETLSTSRLQPSSPGYFSLSGRHLPSLPTQKGIYIKDGRKVLIK